jgi:predicted CXXCH cytochrome family protein
MVLTLLALASAAYAGTLDQRPTPHTVIGRENCLLCHAVGGVKPVPAAHAYSEAPFTNETCGTCHPVASALAAPAATPTSPAAGATPTVAPSPAAPAGPNDACLLCHSNKQQVVNLPDGRALSLYVDAKVFGTSVHGQGKVACADCHVDITGYPHPKLAAKDAREYALATAELCRKCHPSNYARAQDNIHAQVLTASNRYAPVCTDCHGAHDTVKPAVPRTVITQTCARCHQPIYDTYRQSIHGKALVDEQNADVPTCVDCHGVHQMADPRTAAFRLESPELCARCHTNETLMAKYGLSTKVYSTYTEDFHGTTVEFYKTKWLTIWCYKAVCTDCHGIHDIRVTSNPLSSVNAANLVTTCRKCHPEAPPSFVGAWTGHLQPSLERVAPVYYVQLFYQIIIPIAIAGMVVYILMDFARSLLDRRASAAAKPGRAGRPRGGHGE